MAAWVGAWSLPRLVGGVVALLGVRDNVCLNRWAALAWILGAHTNLLESYYTASTARLQAALLRNTRRLLAQSELPHAAFHSGKQRAIAVRKLPGTGGGTALRAASQP